MRSLRNKISKLKVYMPLKSIPKSKEPFTKAVRIPEKYSYENIMKKHQTKHANVQFRNDLLKAKANASYKNEYDRVHNILQHHILHNSTANHDRLIKRKEELKHLFTHGIYPQHEIYKKD